MTGSGTLSVGQQTIAVQAGSVLFVGVGMKIAVDENALIRLGCDPEGRLALTVELFDEDDTLLLAIDQNEWISGDPLPWDFEFGHRWLKLRQKAGTIALSIDARSMPVQLAGRMWRQRQRFDIGSDGISTNGVVQDAAVAELCLVGLALKIDTAVSALQIVADAELGEGTLVSWPEPRERLRLGLEAYERLKGKSSPSAQ